ncbi:hypothetical protein [Nocardiopsis sp. CC223A]|uniref:hypothetical protein n=1 Tax=Nocardiopsis sp. CC223A TaxID=3044051 RepID=UPI00278C7CF5|nr:hypothetical protein [Nocardiopsis sp. CC223A]
MIRLTHRRCRTEAAALDAQAHELNEEAARLTTEADRLNDRCEVLADDLRATEHQVQEIIDACTNLEYGLTEAAVPDKVRERLCEIDRLTDQVRTEHERTNAYVDWFALGRARMLAAAHEAGMLARTYALVEGAGMGNPAGETERLLARVQFSGWEGVPGWDCQDPDCSRSTRELVWHAAAPERAHLVCACGRIWEAESGRVDRSERETLTRQRMGRSYPVKRRWSQTPAPVLEAIDRALPAPADLASAKTSPAALTA